MDIIKIRLAFADVDLIILGAPGRHIIQGGLLEGRLKI